MANIADSLDRLRGWRNQCGYRDTVSGLTTILPRALADADFIVGQL
jgi:hypothetical protein